MPADRKRVVYATFSTWVTPTVQVEFGQPWDADDPVVRSHPDWFSDSPPVVHTSMTGVLTAENADTQGAVIEAATAAPGEKRRRR